MRRLVYLLFCAIMLVASLFGCGMESSNQVDINDDLINVSTNAPEHTLTTSALTEPTLTETVTAPAEPATIPATTAPTDPTPTEHATAPTAPPQESTTKPLEAWQIAYIDFIEEDAKNEAPEFSEFSLIYLDSDNVPELFISTICEASGSIICTFDGSKVVVQQLQRLGGARYIPKSGLILNDNGNMGYYSIEIYKLMGGCFAQTFFGWHIEEYETIEGEDGEFTYEVQYIYKIGESDEPVTKEEFYDAVNSHFDNQKGMLLFDEGRYSHEQIISVIKKK